MLGFLTGNNFPKCGIDFNSGNPDTFSLVRPMSFFINNSSICDTTGQLLFYTNGIYVANSNHDTLLNGQNFNPGWETNDNSNTGSSTPQGAIVLPKPGYPNNYLIIHVSGEEFTSHGQLQIQPTHLSYSEVDMNLDNGLGGIVPGKKNVHLINDTLVHGRITACKHANGRDWWVIVSKFYSNLYYKILVTPDTIFAPYNVQVLGDSIKYDALGQAVFSPDGTKYAMIGQNSNIEFFHFDRCTGDFTTSEHIHLAQGANGIFGGAFSPNSRFLYASNYNYIFQFDTDSLLIASTKKTVAVWQPHNEPFPTEFFSMQLASDNKIYISTYGGCYTMHQIASPDSLDTLCNVLQNHIHFIDGNASIPNFPYYDLGANSGSVCDTLQLSFKKSSSLAPFKLSCFPNPAEEDLNLSFEPRSKVRVIEIFDIYGQLILKQNISPWSQMCRIDVSKLKSGVYLCKLSEGSNSKSVKFIKTNISD